MNRLALLLFPTLLLFSPALAGDAPQVRSASGAPCTAPDNGTGTTDLPAPCPIAVDGGRMLIVNGLSAGDSIKIATVLHSFFDIVPGSPGLLGGSFRQFKGTAEMPLAGVGGLAGYSRTVNIPVQCETHSGPRFPGDPVQPFDELLNALQGQLPPGDPDFDLLRITAGNAFGMPSPGHTTLTRLPSGDWHVDSFFDIVYRIDFVGAPGGPFGGMSGSTTGTIRMKQGDNTCVCLAPDNGLGTVDYPASCPFYQENGTMQIVNGLPAGTTIDLNPRLDSFFDIFHLLGGSLGGTRDSFQASLSLHMQGTNTLSTYMRDVTVPMSHIMTDHAPRTPGAPVQSYESDLFRCFGQITGDPDFDLLRIVAGTDFGLPSPGHTTLTKLGGGDWVVDSFFDIEYRIDFVGAPGGPLAGMSGSTTATIRWHQGCTLPAGSITGTKWNDLNGNGVRDPGEPGLAGWKIIARDTLTQTEYSALTDTGGHYSFEGLTPGGYVVKEVLQAGWMQTGGAPYYQLSVADQLTISGIDFGNFQASGICGHKFNDLDGNGTWDPGEPPLEDWVFCLFPKQIPNPDVGLKRATATFMLQLDALGGEPVSVTIDGYLGHRKGAQPPLWGPVPIEMVSMSLTGIGSLGDSFFDVFTELNLDPGKRSLGGSGLDSFFDIFTELSMNNSDWGGDSFFDVFVELEADPPDPDLPPGSVLQGQGVCRDKNTNNVVGAVTGLTVTIGDPASPTNMVCTKSDSTGSYCFRRVPPGLYNLVEQPQPCWEQTTLPPPPIELIGGVPLPDFDFGNRLKRASICVTKYNDVNHNQKLDSSEPPMEGVQFILTSTLNDTVNGFTDVNGRLCWTDLPPALYELTEVVPAGYTVSVPKNGVLTFGVDNCEDFEAVWLNTLRYTDSLFRTATYREWASSVDPKNKRKEIKCKPHRTEFKLNLVVPFPPPGTADPFSMLELKFSMPVDTLIDWAGKMKQNRYCPSGLRWVVDPRRQLWKVDLNCPSPGGAPPQPGDTIQFDGLGLKGKLIKVGYKWTTKNTANLLAAKGSLPGRPLVPGDTLKQNLRLPMPTLVNVLEELFDQGAFPIVIGADKDSHSVLQKKPTDILKSLAKDNRGVLLYHDSTVVHCLDIYNGKPIKRQLTSHSPDKGSNAAFAEVLTLWLNILASQHGKFPPGLDSLIYDNHKDVQDPTEPLLDGKTVGDIFAQAETLLACRPNPKGLPVPLEEYIRVIRKINKAFAGPVDTSRWSCSKLELKGVRKLKDVPYLRANPNVLGPPAAGNDRPKVERVPEVFGLEQNFPNPFNPATSIAFELSEPSVVTLKVYNVVGQEVASLVDREYFGEGAEVVEFDAGALPSGVYFYRITAQVVLDDEEGSTGATHVAVRKMVLLK